METANRWLGPGAKSSPFLKSACGIGGGNGFAAQQSIIPNYDHLSLEDALFHFIRRVALLCLSPLSGSGGTSGNTGKDYLRQTDGVLSECTLIFLID